MTVKVTKPAINVREELADLKKPTGIAGQAMLAAETPQEQQVLVGVGRRNLLTNGDFKIAQRTISATIPQSDSVYVSVDRWNVRAYSAENFVGTFAQSSDAPKGHKKSLKWTTTTAESAVASDELYSVQTRLEGQDLQHLNYGSSDAQEMTLSFWVKSSIIGTYHAIMYQDDGAKLISKTYNINSANTWEYKTVSISGNTASAINDDNTIGLRLEFVVASGTLYKGTTPTGHWEAYTNAKYNSFASSNGVVTTANATFYITGVQLELGKVATPFEHRSYGEELALCQRYYTKWTIPTQWTGYQNAATKVDFTLYTPVPLRNSTPSLQCVGSFYKWSHEGYQVLTSPSILIAGTGQNQFSNNSILCTVDGFSGGDNGYVANVYISNLEIDDEL